MLAAGVQKASVRCASVVVIVCMLWMTEAIPIGIAALCPVFLMPLFGVVAAPVIAKSYMNDTIFVFFVKTFELLWSRRRFFLSFLDLRPF